MKPEKPVEKGILYFRDSNVVILLMMCGLEIVKNVRDGDTVWFGFCEQDAKPYIDAIYGNKPIPIGDARTFIIANTLFKAIVFEN